MENATSLRLFLKCEQQPCKADTFRNYESSKTENSVLKICLQICPGQSFVLVLA